MRLITRKIMTAALFCATAVLLLAGAALAVTNSVMIDGDVTTTGDWDDEFCMPDEDGQNDQAGQQDLVRLCAASNFASAQPADTIYLRLDWDDTVLSNNTTGNACVLLDTSTDGLVDRALCLSIETQPDGTPPSINSVSFLSCNNSRGDRCAGSSALTFHGTCALHPLASTNPWGENPDADVECSLPLTDLGVTINGVVLIDACSFVSNISNSDPTDCILGATWVGVNTGTGSVYESGPTTVKLSSLSASPSNHAPKLAIIMMLLGAVSLWLAARLRFNRTPVAH